MPKSRRTKRKKRKQRVLKTKRSIGVIYIFSILILILLIIFFVFKLSTVQKFSYVKKGNDGGAEVVVYDPKTESVTKVLIPGSTQLELSYNLGDYRLKNVWELAKSEGLDGVLVTRSLVKNFSIPLYLYKIDSVTNLDIFKRIKMWMVEKRLGGVSIIQHDLSETRTLKEKRLLDGENGFVVKEKIPSYIMINFAQSEFSEFVSMVDIVDKTGDYAISGYVSEILSVMGAKVSSYGKNTPEDFNCIVSGKNEEQVKTTALIFDCEIGKNKEGESDLQISLGRNFIKIF